MTERYRVKVLKLKPNTNQAWTTELDAPVNAGSVLAALLSVAKTLVERMTSK